MFAIGLALLLPIILYLMVRYCLISEAKITTLSVVKRVDIVVELLVCLDTRVVNLGLLLEELVS